MIHCLANICSAVLNKLWGHVTSKNPSSININSRGYFLSNNIFICRESLGSSSGIIFL